jgi:hypothetical protein
MSHPNTTASPFRFSSVSELKSYSAFKVERAFLTQLEPRPSSSIAYRVIGTTPAHSRIELAEFPIEADADMARALFESAARQ